MIDETLRDLRYALRTFAGAPGFTFVAVLTLALGIGSVTVIYSVIHNVLLDPLPYRNSHRLVNVFIRDTQTGRFRGTLPPSEFLDFQEQSDVFEDVIGTLGEAIMYETPDRVESLRGVSVTPNFFDFMGLAPLIGRTIAPEDASPDAPPVVVLRHRAWVSYFGADPNIVGRTILLNREPRTVVGVMPPRFTWHAADLWMPRPVSRGALDPRNPARNFQARLKPGVTLQEAEAQLNLVAARRAKEHQKEYPDKFQVQVVNVIEYTVGAFSGVLYTTLAAVSLLLLIACCNVANMLLAKATTREREMTIRAALGASRLRIARQLLLESLLLAVAGGAMGCLLAYWAIDAVVALLPQGPLPGEVVIGLNSRVLAFSLVTAVLSALVFGITPVWYSARRDLVEGLKSGGKGTTGGRNRVRNTLVVAEIAISLVLILGAGLLMRTFISVLNVDLGFNPRNILVVPVVFSPGQFATPDEKHQFYEEALRRIVSLPDVESAAASTGIPPYSGGFSSELEVPGRARGEMKVANLQLCTPDYFRTLGIRFVRGGDLPQVIGGSKVAVVNRTIAAEYFPSEDPIGKHIRLTWQGRESDPMMHGLFEIVGVVEDVKNQGLRERPAPLVYLPGATRGRANPVILARTASDPNRSLNAIRNEIGLVNRAVALRQPAPLENMLETLFYSQPRFSLVVMGLFAVTGTLLVAIGVFSVMAYTVTRQAREIAVRIALGAGRANVMSIVLRPGAQLLSLGIGVGLLGGFAATRLIANQLWNISPHDPLTLIVSVAVIVVVAMTACYIPARRALRVDPIGALRHD